MRVKWIAFIIYRRPVAPMFVSPEPLFWVLANKRLVPVPTGLRNLLSRPAGREFNRIKNMHHVPVSFRHRDERKDWTLRSLLQCRVQHSAAHMKSKSTQNQTRG